MTNDFLSHFNNFFNDFFDLWLKKSLAIFLGFLKIIKLLVIHFIIKLYARNNTTTYIFTAMDYLVLMSEEYVRFRKKKKYVRRKCFFHPVEATGSMYFRNIFRIM